MTHALARRSGNARDISHDRLGDVLADKLGRRLFVRTANLADHDNAFGLRVLFKQGQDVDEVHATNRVATNTDASALAKAELRRLVNGFISKRARTRNDTNAAATVNVARHDADLGLTRRDNTGAIGTHEASVVRLQCLLHAHHVVHRNAFGDADDELDARVRGLEDGIGSTTGRHIDHGNIGARRLHGVMGGVEYWQPEVSLTTATRRHTTDQLGAVVEAALAVERTLVAREALADYPALFVQQNAHGSCVLAGFRRPKPWRRAARRGAQPPARLRSSRCGPRWRGRIRPATGRPVRGSCPAGAPPPAPAHPPSSPLR